MRICLLFFILFCSAAVFGQTQQKKLVQFSGVIVNVDSNTVVPYVSVTNRSNGNQVSSANYKGYFSFVARTGDTIIFSAVGYRREALIIPAEVEDNKYTVMVKMKQEVINLPVVRVYPWASEDEFKRELLTMKVADDDLALAKKNVASESLKSLAKTLPADGQEIQSLNFQNNHTRLTNKNINQRLANPLLNPFAWGALINQILQGDKSRSN